MGEFLLSVAIPTRNRSFYAKHAARQVLAIGDSRIQVIVHDNSDEPSLRDQLEDLISSGAPTYAYHPGLLSFVDNFEAAVRLAAGDYVCVIGDDDGAAAPTIIDIVDWAARHGVEAVVPSLDAIYYWPGSVDLLLAGFGRPGTRPSDCLAGCLPTNVVCSCRGSAFEELNRFLRGTWGRGCEFGGCGRRGEDSLGIWRNEMTTHKPPINRATGQVLVLIVACGQALLESRSV